MNQHSTVNWSIFDLFLFLSLCSDILHMQTETVAVVQDDEQCYCPRVRCDCKIGRGKGIPFNSRVLEANYGRVN